ncbi:MAG TPA: TonB-dependent receptor [Polyangiaceae bacterium]|nr:TonB-dependent receptor [Polyangiaceae bacterium]
MKLRSLVAGVGLVLTLAPRARAQTSSDLDALLNQSIVSTPSKGSETDATAPATSSVITADELRRYGIRTLDEAIDYLSLGMATSTPSHAVEIGARGVQINGDYGNHVLLLVDGHAVNEPWNGTAYFDRGAGVPFEMIDHIEVILGPGSVLYGAQAMLGVINIVTKRAKDFSGARIVAEGDASLAPHDPGGPPAPSLGAALGYGYRLGAGYGREFSLGGAPSELTLGLEYYANQGPAWQLGPQAYGADAVTGAPKDFGPNATPGVWGGVLRHADYLQAPAAYLRFATGDFHASVRASAFRRSTIYPESLAAYTADFDDPTNREIDRFVNVDLSQRVPLSSRVELMVRGYGDLYDYQWFNHTSAAEDCPDGFTSGCDRFLHGVGRQLGAEANALVQWPILRATTLFGVDARVRDAEDRLTIADRLGSGTLTPTAAHRTDGLIAPYAAQTLSPTSWLDLNLGVRLDDDSRFGTKLSPRTALGVAPWRGGRIKLIYAEAFRGPSAYELTYADPDSQIAAPSLGPETVHSIEGSVEQRFGKHRVLFGVFRSTWSNLVGTLQLSQPELDAAIARGELAPDTAIAYRYANTVSVDNYGLNAAYEGAAVNGRLRFGLNFTSAITHVDPGDGSGPQIPPVAPEAFGNARVSYDLGGKLPTLGLASHFSGRRLADRYYDGGFTPPPSAPPSLSLRATVSGAFPAVPGLTYRAGFDYSFARVEPYAIGANIYANANVSRAELAPTRRAQAFVGFEYAFEHAAAY